MAWKYREGRLLETLDPKAFGFYEKRPGSGVWYHPATSVTYEPRVCTNPECGKSFMGQRSKGRGRFCSKSCAQITLAKRSDDPSYSTLHQRVRTSRGRAADHACVDCGQPARDWSQRHGTDGQDVNDYDPRCRACHSAYDDKRGETHAAAKLTESQVRGIYGSVGATQTELAEIHGVSIGPVSSIRQGRTWKHITGGERATW